MVSVPFGIFDKKVSAAGDGNSAETDRAVDDVEIPAVEMNIDAVQAAVFEAKIFIEICSENTPSDVAAFRDQIAKGAFQHPRAADSVSAGCDDAAFVGAILLPGNGPDIFERYIVNPAKNVEASPGLHRNIAFSFFESHPLVADDRAASGN